MSNPYPPYISAHHLYNEGRVEGPNATQRALSVLRRIADYVPETVPDDWVALLPAKLLREAKAAVDAL